MVIFSAMCEYVYTFRSTCIYMRLKLKEMEYCGLGTSFHNLSHHLSNLNNFFFGYFKFYLRNTCGFHWISGHEFVKCCPKKLYDCSKYIF